MILITFSSLLIKIKTLLYWNNLLSLLKIRTFFIEKMAAYSCIGLGDNQGVGLQHRRPMFEFCSFSRFGALLEGT